MKRRPAPPSSKQKIKPEPSACIPDRIEKTAKHHLPTTPVPLKRRRKVGYIPGELPREELADAPRLFIRGIGGSIKLDLCGVGTNLSHAAFAHHVADDSLACFQIRRGDIVLIEPSNHFFRENNLVLLEIDGRAVLRRITKKNRLWYLDSMNPADSPLVPLTDQPLQGFAVGIIRLFNPLKPVKFRYSKADFEISFQQSKIQTSTSRTGRKAAAPYSHSKGQHRKASASASMLAAERKGNFRLSEVEQASGYTTWPKTR